ncbi:hypothetical protein [Sphingomonas quercus]|uniref:hypothetical protein n=1 Tax=Sphingomonas quercus TaxID=2842451 RepID=UPI001C0BEC15|nr:hypothetical protein [Sphingomonas quercus]
MRFRHAEREASFTIDADQARRWVQISIVGTWTISIAEQHRAALLKVATSLDAEAARSFWLVDLRERLAHPKEVADYIGGSIAKVTSDSRHVVALVLGTAIAGLQAKRLSAGEVIRAFPSYAEAERWLEEQQASA